MRVLVCVCVVLMGGPVWAQDCTPVAYRGLVWGQPGERIVWSEVVPAGEVWELESGGLATTDNRVLAYMGQHYVPPGWYIPLASPVTGNSTPSLAFPRGLILSAGERIGGRVNAPEDFAQMAVLFKVFRYPEACLARLKGVASITGLSGQATDFSGLRMAAQAAAAVLSQAAAAMTDVSTSVP
jgi:hypothetical protein